MSQSQSNTPDSPQAIALAKQHPEKSSKKLTTKQVILSIIAIVLFFASLIGYELYAASTYKKAYNNYISGKGYEAYAADMRTLLQGSNSLFANMYNCSAKAEAVIAYKGPALAPGQVGNGATYDYDRYQTKLRNSGNQAITAQPKYHGGILASLIPPAKRARLAHKNLDDLMTATQIFINSRGTPKHPYSYCVDKLYNAVVTLRFLSDYSDTKNLSQAFNIDFGSYIKLVDGIKANKLGTYLQYGPTLAVPANMTSVDSTFTTYLTKVEADLNTALTIKQKTSSTNPYNGSGLGDFGTLNTTFAADLAELDTTVLAKAEIQGKNIQPSPAQLQNLLNNVTKQ